MSLSQTQKTEFINSTNAITKRITDIVHDKGFRVRGADPREAGTLIALMHSELSEALEGARHGNPDSDKIPEFSSLEEEMADTIIRIYDFADEYGLRLPEAILAKIAYNADRPYKHGKKF